MRTSSKMIMTTLTLGLGLAACGGSSDDDMGKFTGTWRTTSGSATWSCPGIGSSTSAVSTNIVWSKGVSSDLVQTEPGSSCVIEARASGSTATGSSSPCSVSDGSGGTDTLTVTSYTFVVAPDGRTAQESESATVTDVNGGATATCTVTETASYEKVGN